MKADNGKRPSRVTVRASGASYAVVIQDGLLSRAGRELDPLMGDRKVFILSDTNVWELWGRQLSQALAPRTLGVILTPPGERYKRMATVERITQELARHGAERSSLLVAFGGGVVGDMGGFAAAVFLRGIDCVQIPTTLLAQVDSAIGGKTGVNLEAGKNLVGTFSQPRMVLSDPRLLRTLPPRELRAGLFEAVKCGVIGDRKLFEFLWKERACVLRGDPQALAPVIHACAALKGRVVSRDEKEGGLRRILNFGHTVGHALEAATAYRRFLHGEAVAWGMLAATRLAVDTGLLSAPQAERIAALIIAYGAYGPVPPLRGLPFDALWPHLTADKKVRGGVIHFVLPRRIGQVEVVPGITRTQIERTWQSLLQADPFRQSAHAAKGKR